MKLLRNIGKSIRNITRKQPQVTFLTKDMTVHCDKEAETLENALFISSERTEEMDDILQAELHLSRSSGADAVEMIQIMSKYCNHPNELAYCSFIIGLQTTQIHTR
jgi:hypothetical protein